MSDARYIVMVTITGERKPANVYRDAGQADREAKRLCDLGFEAHVVEARQPRAGAEARRYGRRGQ